MFIHQSMKQYIALISLFILLIFSTTALSDDGGYVVRPHVEGGVGVDSTGADATITFWDLPLWIQVYYVSGLLIAFLGSFKIFPAVISRIKRFIENQNRQKIFEYILDNQRNPRQKNRSFCADDQPAYQTSEGRGDCQSRCKWSIYSIQHRSWLF